jgi:hypothetical protein
MSMSASQPPKIDSTPWSGQPAADGGHRPGLQGEQASVLFSTNVDHVQRICKFVCHFHSPFLAWLKVTVDIAEGVASDDSSFMPRGMPIGKLFSLDVEVRSIVVNVKKISRHLKQSRREKNVPKNLLLSASTKLSYLPVPPPKLDVMTVDVLLRLFNRGFIVRAIQHNGFEKMPVIANQVDPVIGHGAPPRIEPLRANMIRKAILVCSLLNLAKGRLQNWTGGQATPPRLYTGRLRRSPRPRVSLPSSILTTA